MSDRLSGLDASFLHLERDDAHMHVASTTLFEGPAPDYVEFREHIASRLHLVPRFRQKLKFVPFGQGRPVWVDDPHLNLDYHVRHTSLPTPGSEEQLRTLAARIFSQQLDRSKPLWELWLVEGLTGGRFAIIGKSHHCMVDGVSGVDITTVLFDASPEAPERPDPPEWLPKPEPSDAQVLGEALIERAVNPAEGFRLARRVLRGPRRAIRKLGESVAAASSLAWAGIAAPHTPFNVEIGPHRRFVWVRSSLSDVKTIKNALGGTVNDVVLSTVAGGLGRFLRSHGFDTDGLEIRAMVPVSVRTADQSGALGNRVSAIMARLPVWCEDPVKRTSMITERMGDLKGSRQAMAAELMTELADFAPPTIAGQAARLQSRQRFFNLVVTNVPGPQFPLYLMGRRMERVFPMVPLAKRQALCVGIMSYDGQLNFGLISDYDAIPDLDQLARDIEASLDELLLAAGGGRRIHRRFRTATSGSSPQPREKQAVPADQGDTRGNSNGNGNGAGQHHGPADVRGDGEG